MKQDVHEDSVFDNWPIFSLCTLSLPPGNSKGVEKGCIGNKLVKFVNLFLNLNLLIFFYSTWLYGSCMTIVQVRKKYFMDTFSLENLLKKTLVLISSTNQCDIPNVTVSGYMPIEFGYSMEL